MQHNAKQFDKNIFNSASCCQYWIHIACQSTSTKLRPNSRSYGLKAQNNSERQNHRHKHIHTHTHTHTLTHTHTHTLCYTNQRTITSESDWSWMCLNVYHVCLWFGISQRQPTRRTSKPLVLYKVVVVNESKLWKKVVSKP